MLSKLCTVRHFRTLSSRTPSQSFAPPSHSCAFCSNVGPAIIPSLPEIGKENNHCHLVQCSFCDHNLYSLANSYPQCEESPEAVNNNYNCVHITDNPAYGLPSKEWVECTEMEISNCKLNNPRRKENQNESNNTPKKVTVPNCNNNNNSITSSYLESIPESREDCIIAPPMSSNMERDALKNDLYNFASSEANLTTQVTTNPYHRSLNTDTMSSKWNKRVADGNLIRDKQCDNNYLPQLDQQQHLKLNQLSSDTDEVKVINTRPKFNQREKQAPGFISDTQQRTTEKLQFYHHNHELRSLHAYQQRTRNDNATKLRRNLHLTTKDKSLTLGNHKQNETRDGASKNHGSLLAEETLAEIASVKTEESVQEWLSRISEWVESNSWIKDTCDDDDDDILGTKNILGEDCNVKFSQTDSRHSLQMDELQKEQETQDAMKHDHSNESDLHYTDEDLKDASASAKHALQHATKDSPAKVPMVVMQCSRLHSHISSKPPFQQSSLPMGTLVTALYQEADWLYVQTPHGVEGFVSSANCIPIGTVRTQNQSKRPWEPCDFPIEIPMKNNCDFARQHTMFLPTKLPVRDCTKQLAPFVNVVKMKTCFYGDKHFSHTFKHRDSIKTAKTVTDILRSSPEIEINNM